MIKKSRIGSGLLGVGAVIALVLGSAVSAQAVSATVGGDVNCNGYNVYYSTTRYVSANSTRIQYTLSNSAGSSEGLSGTYLGVHLNTSNTYLGQKSMTIQSPTAVLSPYYVKGTSFTLYGHMDASLGVCDNHFSGTLYY